jgi:hypothetical protein
MADPGGAQRSRAPRRWAGSLGWGLLFALAYGQSPLYSSNQNQYFLHGAARAGLGDLAADWLAGTADPTPVFSLLVEATFRLGALWLFQLYALALAAVYLLALEAVAAHMLGPRWTAGARALFLGAMTLLHSSALRFLLVRTAGPSAEYLFDGGLAGQRLLGPVFQPSMFGVLLLVALLLHLQRRPAACAMALAAAGVIHPTYLLPAALLTVGVMADGLLATRRLGPPLAQGALTLALVSPIVAYVAVALGPTTPTLARQAQEVLVTFRIPHHALIGEWLGPDATVRLALIGLGLLLARRSRLASALWVAALGGLALTLVQAVTGNHTLALLFPWRISTVLVPLGTALGAGWLSARLAPALERRSPRAARWPLGLMIALALALAAAGLARFALELERQRADPARPMLQFVAATRAPGDLYLIPPRLQEFRLAAGAPAFVDFKSIPYLDREVLEWYQRTRLAGWFYRDTLADVDCGLLDTLRQEYGVTHVVLDQNLLSLSCPAFGERLHADASFAVVRLLTP